MNRRRPVHQQELPGRRELVDGQFAQFQEVGHRQIIADLGNHDQIERAVGKLAGQRFLLEADIVQCGATFARRPERLFRNVDGKEPSAPGSQLACQNADRAARLERRGIVRTGQGSEGRGVLGGFIRARHKIPRVRVRAVNVVEISGCQAARSVGIRHGDQQSAFVSPDGHIAHAGLGSSSTCRPIRSITASGAGWRKYIVRSHTIRPNG